MRIYWCGTPLAGCRTTLSSLGRLSSPRFNPATSSYAAVEEGWVVTLPGLNTTYVRAEVRTAAHYDVLSTVLDRDDYAAQAAFLLRADGIVFVVDSQSERFESNCYYIDRLRRDLVSLGRDLDRVPLVLQMNKRDLSHVMDAVTLEARLGTLMSRAVATVAPTGAGLLDVLTVLNALIERR